MYRLLIVDDEPFIADGLYRYFLGIKHLNLDVYRAYSAREAIGWLDRTKIDIVISDIQMPGMSGLQLIKEIRDKWPLCHVIFLTGFNEFEYAYTAMQYEAASYILKNEGDEAILKAVEKCIAEIEKSIKDDELIKNAHEQMNMSLPLLQKEYLMDILQGENTTLQMREEQFNELHIPLDASVPVLLLGGKIDNYSVELPSAEKVRCLSGIEVVFREYLGHMTLSASITWERRLLLWLIQPRHAETCDDCTKLWEKTILFIRGTLETIQEVCKQSLGVSLSLVLDNKPSEWEKISERYYSMRQIINYQMGRDIEMALTDKEFFYGGLNPVPEYENAKHEMQVYLEKLYLLKTYLESGQKEEFLQLLTNGVEILRKYGQFEICFANEIYHSVCLVFLSYINRLNLKEGIAPEIDLDGLIHTNEFIARKETFESFFRLSEWIFQYQNIEQKQRFDALIQNLHQYIHDNLGSDLSLVTLAEKVYLNPTYLSRLYKQVTGRNISEYIGDLRLNRAKRLLQKNELKINEIALAVGYESAAHFSRIFKRATHLTPQEYRDSLNTSLKQSNI